jgi:hypothetical protein
VCGSPDSFRSLAEVERHVIFKRIVAFTREKMALMANTDMSCSSLTLPNMHRLPVRRLSRHKPRWPATAIWLPLPLTATSRGGQQCLGGELGRDTSSTSVNISIIVATPVDT